MSLLKWKEMAEKRSELGQRINEVRKTIKQKSISDQIGQVEAAKLFEPITSGLRDITAPKIPLRRLKKRGPVPDYGLEMGDDEEVPDCGLEDQFGEQVLPQNDKQLVPKPPSYQDVLEDLASGEKKMYIDPEYMYEPEDLPPEYEEEEGPDYAIIEEDRINEALDKLGIPNYEVVELRLQQKEMNDQKRKAYLKKILNDAKNQRFKLTGYSADVTKKLKSKSITDAEAQIRRKFIQDTRKVLNDYMKYNDQKLKNIKGSGLKKKTKRGGSGQRQSRSAEQSLTGSGQVHFFNDPIEMMKKLELIIGSMAAGNNSIKLRNMGVALLDMLFRNSTLNRSQYNKIYRNYFYVN